MTLQAQFAAVCVDEWRRAGVRYSVISPGSRSSLLALALLAEDQIQTYVRLDERSAAFFALGIALQTRQPVVVLTTSGTATAELHAAVLEADLARVPLIVVTADRPSELHRVGAPQTVEQVGMFGSAVRFSDDVSAFDGANNAHWRSMASRLVGEATSSSQGPGPVHCNIAFREPFVLSHDLPIAGRARDKAWHEVVRSPGVGSSELDAFLDCLHGARRGVFVVGALPDEHSAKSSVLSLARQLNWPVLGDPRAWPRTGDDNVVSHADGILRSALAQDRLIADVVVHFGAPHSSKVLTQWFENLAHSGTRHVLADPNGLFVDPNHDADLILRAHVGPLCEHACARLGSKSQNSRDYLDQWHGADVAADHAIAAVLEHYDDVVEPWVARQLFSMTPPGATVVVSSSMPIRDLEWFASARENAPKVLANRGANGIDGITSTILGVAAGSSACVVGLVGDLAFFHDLSGLVWGVLEHPPTATLVVIDNNGGGIFSFLDYADSVGEETFGRAFGTPQSPDIVNVASALGCVAERATTREGFVAAVERAITARGINVVVVETSRYENVACHRELNEAITSAVEDVLQA